MKTLRYIATAIAILGVMDLSLAQLTTNPDDHASHHPDAVPSADAARPDKKAADTAHAPEAAPARKAEVDSQMRAMQQMHEKMMNAKTPDERNALMAEHMKTMQSGMSMMRGASGMGMGGTGNAKGMSADMAKRQQMMEQRMDMMQMMMEMMMDRLPALPPSK